MFTGLVTEIGTLRQVGARLSIECAYESLELGESIAVSGVCLTVARIAPRGFEADASAETLSRTTLGQARVGSQVNLERALRPRDRLGGHLVSGHVDAVGTLRRTEAIAGARRLTFGLDRALARYVAEKGSITIDGVSLTVNGVSEPSVAEAWFHVAIIPHTETKTTLSAIEVGAPVNLEVDLVARYVARLAGFEPARGSSDLGTLLKTHGFDPS